jgi:hypothetical protein
MAASERFKRFWDPRRWARRLMWTAVALLALGVAAWLGVPPLLQWQGQKIGSETLGRPVQIGAVRFEPWALALTVSDVRIGGAREGDPPQFEVKRVFADFSPQSLLRLAPVLQSIRVDEPVLRLRYLGDGHYDVDDVIARLTGGDAPPAPPENEKDKPLRFALNDIAVQGGRVTFIDEPLKQTHELADLQLTLPAITNRPSRRKERVTPQLAFTLDGTRFDSGAQALPFDDSRHTEARLRLERLDLAPYLAYQPAGLPLRLMAGALEADLRLTFEEAPQPALRIAGSASLSGVRLNDAAGQQTLAFERLAVDAAELRPLEHALHFSRVELTAPRVLASRDAQGRINWVRMFNAPPAAAAPKKPAASAASAAARAAPKPADTATADWRVRVDRLAIDKGDAQWRDAQPAPGADAKTGAAAVRVAPFSIEVRNLQWPATQPATFNGRLALADVAAQAQAAPQPAVPKPAANTKANTKASTRAAPAKQNAAAKTEPAKPAEPASPPSIAFEGQAHLKAAKVSVQARGLPLHLAQPYLAAVLKPRLTGSVDADADITWSAENKSAPGLTLDVGKLALNQLALLGDTGEARTPARAAAPRNSRASRNTSNTRADDLPPGTLARIDALTVEGAKLDLPGRAVAVDALTVQAPRLSMARDKNGRWMAEDWLVQPSATPSSPPPPAPSTEAKAEAQTETPPWSVRVARVAVDGGALGWRDRVPASGMVDVTLSQIKLTARDFELGAAQPVPLELSALLAPRRGEPGKLSWRGAASVQPPGAQGDLDAQRLPLHVFEPYVSDYLNIDILRADASFKGKVDYAQQDRGPRLRVTGDARIEELRTTSHPGSAAGDDPGGAAEPTAAAAQNANTNAALAPSADATAAASGGLGEELMSWKQLRMSGLNLRLDPGQPPRLAVRNSQLSDFYARIIVHPNGRINLQDVVKTSAAASATSAASAAPTAPASTAAAPRLRFGPTRLLNGRIAFSDHFIRPNYSADLSGLNGSLGPHGNGAGAQASEMATLELQGRAQGTAQLTVTGRLNPLAQPLALDIAAQLTDLELAPLTPYAVKYAGHGIERGKLSMDVAYKIEPDGQLTASNKLTLNQLQFGEEVPGAPASLPVSLATALLADGDGVIRLDLPVSGSLNDPEFSLGPVIFKAFMGLIGKAITAPFALLANALGGGDDDGELSRVRFAPGSAELTAPAKQRLDRIAKAMTERPQLKLTVSGAARLADEGEDFKRARLQTLIAAERRAASRDDAPASQAAVSAAPAVSAAAAAASAPDAATADADYPQLLRRLYRRADIPGKPRNLIGMTRDVPVEQMEALLLAQISASEDDIRQLATQRAMAVKDDQLAAGLHADRVCIGAPHPSGDAAPAAPSVSASAAEPARWRPHAELGLGAR